MPTRTLIPMIALAMTIVGRSPAADTWYRYGGDHGDFSVDGDLVQLQPSASWQVELGRGRSGIVCDTEALYVTYLKPWTEVQSQMATEDRPHVQVTAALGRSDGRVMWQREQPFRYRDRQQTFGGRDRAPQATPLLVDLDQDRKLIVTISFGGDLTVRDRRTGDQQWSVDLVERFDAAPVAFGYSASPILVEGQLIVFAGGKLGGLVSFSPASGDIRWKFPCGEASYATPVHANIHGTKQIITCTRNRILSVDLDGRLLWERPLPKPGLTNVPTPLVLNDSIILSGQGVGGTQRLRISQNKESSDWQTEEVWFSDQPFFYCNWLVSRESLIGCTGNLLVMLDLDSGQTIGKWRGFENCNVTRCGDRVLVVHGADKLTSLIHEKDALRVEGAWELGAGRCWTPATWIDEIGVIRIDTRLLQIRLAATPPTGGSPLVAAKTVERLKIRRPEERRASIESIADPVDAIVKRYEADGPDAAVDLYNELRKHSDAFDTIARQRLADLARKLGQEEFADRIPGDAFVDNASEPNRNWLLESTRVLNDGEASSRVAESGLTYLRFAIVNLKSTIQAQVRGPVKHPFGYGLPLRTGQVRRENWPVGTRLTDSSSGRLLLEVEPKHAGQLVVLP
ncbi:MAG: PQQ-binding-like beta-propeller repeat protein [Planctomycetota bacterium]